MLNRLGFDVVKKIESTKTNGRDAPVKAVVIADCGTIEVSEPFVVSRS